MVNLRTVPAHRRDPDRDSASKRSESLPAERQEQQLLIASEPATTPLFSACDGATAEAPSPSPPAESVLRHTARVPVVLRPPLRSTSGAQHYVACAGWG